MSANFLLPGSWRLMETFSPSDLNGRPPACQISDVVMPASPVSLTKNLVGSAACSFFASAM